jgi:predicted phosphodiesterase
VNYIPLLKKPAGAVSWLSLSCSHAPLHDKTALAIIAERIAELKPDQIIHKGDLHEADSASRWPSEYSWDIADEFHAANEEVLKPLRKACPSADCVFLPGNHDDNILAIDRIPSKVRGRCDWTIPQYSKGANGKPVWLNEELLKHWRIPAKYRYNRHEGTYRIGATIFAHGYEAGASSDEAQAITLGWPYGLFISGHTHRPTVGEPRQAMKTKTLPLPFWYLNSGFTGTFEVPYMERKRQGMWGQAFCYGWSMPVTSPRFSRTWDAYCELIQPFEKMRAAA